MALKMRKVRDSYFDLVKEFPLRKIRSAEEHRQALALVSRFAGREKIDEGAVDYLGVLADLIVGYEKIAGQTIDTTNVTPVEVVRHLMNESGLTISGLAREIGVGQSNLSEMLSGKREWSKAAIRGISERFSLNPMFFLEN
jgi:antitoxin component HigA of HigAB toxin-antitoxin module